ncbi:MAG: hypothetical protein NT135_01040 [Candidatus Berkelbacteria bacterium]|nr:hypothetical protein [Candidatus Berkelbacteria bacterium]
MNKKYWLILAVIIWATFILVSGLAYYVNHYLPHGSSYPTGEVVCRNDDRGPCGEEYKEDLRGLNIPNWAKFFRNDNWILLWIGLGIAGIAISGKSKS